MDVTAAIILSIIGTLSIAAIPLSIYAVIFSYKAKTELEAFKKSTHTVQYINPESELMQQTLAKQEANYYDETTLANVTKNLEDESIL